MNREFVFRLSAYASECLADDPDCHVNHVAAMVETMTTPCIVEGERNPFEFAKLYDPQKDMVFFLERRDVPAYETSIESGIGLIEYQLRWAVENGIAPQHSILKMAFGDERLHVSHYGFHRQPDEVLLDQEAVPRHEGDDFPWMGVLPQMARQHVAEFYQQRGVAPYTQENRMDQLS